MFVPKAKSHQLAVLPSLKKMFFGAMVFLCSFLQAGNKNDSIESSSIEQQTEIYILEGTIISGADKLYNSEIKTIKRDTIVEEVIVKQPLRKSQIAKIERSLSDHKIVENLSSYTIEIPNQEQERKYRSLFFNELQATKENVRPAYDFSFFIHPLFLRLPSGTTRINFFRISGKTYLPDRYSCIRPPPGSVA